MPILREGELSVDYLDGPHQFQRVFRQLSLTNDGTGNYRLQRLAGVGPGHLVERYGSRADDPDWPHHHTKY